MSTFLLFVLIFGLFAWGMWRLLKFTRNTVGENSPLKVSRVYGVSKFRYFMGFDGILASFMGIMGVVLFFQLARIPPPIDKSYYYLAIYIAPLSLLGVGALSFALQFNHWPYVRGVVIRTNPGDHSLEISFSNRSLTVREGDIEKIYAIHGKARMSYAYSTYYLVDGERFIMSSRMPGEEVIREYFPKIPFSSSENPFGFIKE